MRLHCFARCRPVSPARVLGCPGMPKELLFSRPAFMRGMYFSTNLILVNAVNHLLNDTKTEIIHFHKINDKIPPNLKIKMNGKLL